MRIHRAAVTAAAAGALGLAAPAAHGSAAGWSTPHTASTVTTGIYATGSGGQGAQLFANGGVSQRTAQLRAIKTDATPGTAVKINAGGPGFDRDGLSVNDSGRLIAAWTMDLERDAGQRRRRARLPHVAAPHRVGVPDRRARRRPRDGRGRQRRRR